MCLLAAFVPHRPNKYFHVTASNGIVSNSPYTPLAIMTASPIASVRVFDPRCRCRLATFAALPTPSMIEQIIMLTDHPLLAPHRQVRRCHRSIHCWHGHAARRSALPRERFSPMALFGLGNGVSRCPFIGAKQTSQIRDRPKGVPPPVRVMSGYGAAASGAKRTFDCSRQVALIAGAAVTKRERRVPSVLHQRT
jgi:hypothetical protein